jgi:penicillin-binding protein 1C
MFRVRRPFTVLFLLLGVICGIAAIDAGNPPDMTRYEQVSPEVVARDGTLLRAFLSSDGFWRMRTAPSDVSPRYLAMLKAYEDKRFDNHFGVDPIAMGRAVLQYAGAGHVVSGGSTLSMQAARLLEPPKHRGIATKLFQMIRAVQLEERYSKDRILSIYLSLAPFGGNLEGVKAASLSYFGKPPNRIDLAEAALLVALPQSPVKQRPDRHAIAAAKGRDKVLTRMAADGVIAAPDAKLAMHEGVPFARQPMPFLAPQLADRLHRRNKSRIRFDTAIDATLQTAVEEMARQEARYQGDGASMAIVVVENGTRNVLAYVGGVDYWGPAGQLDLAQSPRSPGSALKPFIYGMAFDALMLHPQTMMEDSPTAFGDYMPRDFEGSFQGAVTAETALRMSLNVPAVMVLEKVGPLAFTIGLQNAGAHLAFPAGDGAPSLPVALGGLGISPADLTMLYAGIANGGEVRALRIVKDAPPAPTHRIFGPVAAYYLRDILDGVALPEGWAMGEGLKRRAIGFKTGTSYGFRDAWCAGFSNDYTVGVWVGRADGTPRPGHIGRETGAPILLKVFGLLPADRSLTPDPPRGAILAAGGGDLPAALRVFRRERHIEETQAATVAPPPAITYPPNGTVVPLPSQRAADRTILLKAQGGSEPLTWLVNGALIGSFTRFDSVPIAPREGVARITVVDAAGRSDTSQVRFIREK